ncbi:DUF2213 domain-containing protein [Gluconobacter albidus]|uniref:DUF2213 domain-containing protein n=1 Tax=Gluconobacter albidus TaxID=318683 RepID=UPI00209D762A|nr:DUF2213 domain-containing protein [Gluconobacter albidus]MCP1274796.1 DUF2213 domain-containing protein [Gluconobacter albidus]
MTDTIMALDRSVRRIDADGHLHVERCVLSAAVVSPYYGWEINGAERLGLEPDTIYWMYRDADALREAASSMNGKPLIEIHQPVSADDHPREITVGSVNNATFQAPDLIGELSIWDGDAIKRIQDGSKRCVSAGYAYETVPETGEINGQRYTLKMVNIRFNHLALVEEPRVKTAIIGDSAPPNITKETSMAAHKPMSAAAKVAAALKSGRLAMDASEEDVKKCMDEDETEDDKKKAEDESEEEREDKDGKKAEDAKACDEDDTDDDQAADEDDDDKKDEKKDDKKGMDAASVSRLIEAAVSKERRRSKLAQDAREAVRPLVGDVIGMDSAGDIYRYALKQTGHDAAGVHDSALPALVSMAINAKRPARPARMAGDSAIDTDSPLAGASARRKA